MVARSVACGTSRESLASSVISPTDLGFAQHSYVDHGTVLASPPPLPSLRVTPVDDPQGTSCFRLACDAAILLEGESATLVTFGKLDAAAYSREAASHVWEVFDKIPLKGSLRQDWQPSDKQWSHTFLADGRTDLLLCGLLNLNLYEMVHEVVRVHFGSVLHISAATEFSSRGCSTPPASKPTERRPPAPSESAARPRPTGRRLVPQEQRACLAQASRELVQPTGCLGTP